MTTRNAESKKWFELFVARGLVVWVLCFGFSAMLGCQKGEIEEDEAHHIPEHFPADFERAMVRLEQLVAHLKDGVALEEPPSEVTAEVELLDVVRWLPELAARSDLKESDWNIVDNATRDLIESLDASKAMPEKSLVPGDALAKIATLPKELAEVREKFRAMQVPDVVDEAEPETNP